MNNIFSQRRNQAWARYAKYGRLAFNDHFIIFLLIVVGVGIYAYRNWLPHVTSNVAFNGLLILLSLMTLFFGSLATFFKPADQIFLLADEQAGRNLLNRGFVYSSIMAALMMGLAFLVLTPIALKTVGLWFWLNLVITLIVTKVIFLWLKRSNLQNNGQMINYRLAIDTENQRQQRINRFYSLFTDVKELHTSVKARKYLSWFSDYVLMARQDFYHLFFANKFVRGQYLGLILRLALVGLFLLYALSLKIWWVVALVILGFSYLIGFQMLSMFYEDQNNLMTKVYPIELSQKSKALNYIISVLLGIFAFFAVIVSFSHLGITDNVQMIVVVTIGLIILTLWYFPWRLRK